MLRINTQVLRKSLDLKPDTAKLWFEGRAPLKHLSVFEAKEKIRRNLIPFFSPGLKHAGGTLGPCLVLQILKNTELDRSGLFVSSAIPQSAVSFD